MKRLSLVFIIAAFAFLVISKATAVIIYESDVAAHFLGSAADGGTYSYLVSNNAYGTEGEEVSNIWWFTLVFEPTIFNPILPSNVQTPEGWTPIVVGQNEMNFTMDPRIYGIAPGASLGGFEVAVTFQDPSGPVPLTQDYTVAWDGGGSHSAQTHTPEPTTLLLLSGGLIVITAGYAKRKKKHN
jgi:hypothetical protein